MRPASPGAWSGGLWRACAGKLGIDTERAGAGRNEIKENETVDRSCAAIVFGREEALRKMADEIGGCHQARQYESGNACLEAYEEEEAEREFQKTGDPGEGAGRRREVTGVKMKDFSRAVGEYHETKRDAQGTEEGGLRVIEIVLHRQCAPGEKRKRIPLFAALAKSNATSEHVFVKLRLVCSGGTDGGR